MTKKLLSSNEISHKKEAVIFLNKNNNNKIVNWVSIISSY